MSPRSLFDRDSTVIHDRLPLEKVPPMTEKDYFARGCTALLDAVGEAIHHIGNVHKYARREDVPEKTLFIITTDGYENASRRYSYETVQRMIERQKTKYGWEFLFLGANIDAAKEAARFGISAERAVDYKCDEVGTALNYDVISEAICTVRASRPLSPGWKARIDADVKNVGGNQICTAQFWAISSAAPMNSTATITSRRTFRSFAGILNLPTIRS